MLASAPPPRWLPDFCGAPTLFAVILIAEIVAVIGVFAPSDARGSWWERLSLASLYCQWIALVSAAFLCLLRKRLERFSPRIGLLLAYALVMAVTWVAAVEVYTFDHALELGLTLPLESRSQFVYGSLIAAGAVTAAALRYGYIHEQWKQQVEAHARAQVDALQARIRPHFLFNSMNTIASLVRSEPQIAERAVEDLSELFRAALANDRTRIALGEEFALARRYLEIEGLRLGDRLRLRVEHDHGADGLQVPPLILQPLVENAVYHGIQGRVDGGEIALSVRCTEREVEIEILNPLAESWYRGQGHGIAQANVRDRLRYLYGDRARLEAGPVGDRYRCALTLPLA